MSDTIKIRITSDPFKQMPKHAVGMYDEFFAQLTPQQNCLVFDKMKDMEACAQSLERFAKKHHPGAKVRTTKSYATDGLPRCWLIYPKNTGATWNPALPSTFDGAQPKPAAARQPK